MRTIRVAVLFGVFLALAAYVVVRQMSAFRWWWPERHAAPVSAAPRPAPAAPRPDPTARAAERRGCPAPFPLAGELTIPPGCPGAERAELAVTVDSCQGEPIRLASTPGKEWNYTARLPYRNPFCGVGYEQKDGADWIALQVAQDMRAPAREYRLGEEGARVELSASRWSCPDELRGAYRVLRFPTEEDMEAHEGEHHVVFHLWCDSTRTRITGCLRMQGPVAQIVCRPSPGEEFPWRRAAAGEVAVSPAPRTHPTGRCFPPPAAKARSAAPSAAGFEALHGRRVDGTGRLPSAVDVEALARRYLPGLRPEAPLPAALRKEMAERRRQMEAASDGDDPPPTSVSFDLPLAEVPGRFYVFTPEGPVELRPRKATGTVHLSVDTAGCEWEPRSYAGSVALEGPGDGVLVWSRTPLQLGPVEPIPEERLQFEGAGDAQRLVLQDGGRRIVGPSVSALGRAYLVHDAASGAQLMYHYPVERNGCVQMALFQVGTTLDAIGWAQEECY